MKSFVNFCVLIVMNITIAHATLDGTKVKNSVILNSNSSYQMDPVKITKQDQVLGCSSSGNDLNVSPAMQRLASRMLVLEKHLSCDDTKFISYGRFTTDGCNNAVACRKSFKDLSSNSSEKLLNEVVAKDFVANMLNFKTDLMDNLELLKRFADSKYNIKSEKCNSRYKLPARSSSCNLNLLDEVFVNNQEQCEGGESCFDKSGSHYSKFKIYKDFNQSHDIAYVVDYNEYRMTQELIKIKEADESLLNDLANLSMSEKFISLTAIQKTDMFLKELEPKSGDRYKDPFFALDLGKVSEKDKFKKTSNYQLIVKMFEKPFPSKEVFKSTYENLRQNRAKQILNESQTCSNQPDLKKICEEMTKISTGESIFKNPFEAELLSTKNLNKDKDYEKFLSYIGKDLNKNRYELLLNAKRCVAFGLANENKVLDETEVSRLWHTSVNGGDEPNNRIITKSRSQNETSFLEESPKKETLAPKLSDPKLSDPKIVEDNKNINSPYTNNSAVANNSTDQFEQRFTPSKYNFDNDGITETAERKADVVQVTNPTNVTTNDANMTELMRRLAASEEKVDKMKAASDEAESESIKQKKIDEENVLIKELRGQIADLKDTKTKKDIQKDVAIVNPTIEQTRPQSNNFASSFNNGVISAPGRQEAAPKPVENYDSGRSTSSSQGGASATTGSKSVSAPVLTSTTNIDSNKVAPAAAAFTTVDGMSSEKVIQTISKKIIELNGTPFYIEDAGVIIEIIAVVKDGKILLDEKGNPVYEKIVKGKVGDKAVTKLKDQKKAPLAITNAADLKRDQEEKLKRERAEYLKLKNLTNGIINNKQ